jgi:hypothetical protein
LRQAQPRAAAAPALAESRLVGVVGEAAAGPSGRAAPDRDDGGGESVLGEERIANEMVKLGILLSPRTMRRYMPSTTPDGGHTSQEHVRPKPPARGVLASDFFVVVTCDQQLIRPA